MGAVDWSAATRIFDEIVELPLGERERALAARCGSDAALRAAVAELLAGDDRAREQRFLAERPATPFEAGPIAAGLAGARLDGFILLRPLGHGGMGMVFEAEQENPRRKVAVKVLKPAFAAGAALQRFQVEAEILARLRHTNIAQVIASGVHRFAQGPFAFDLPWYAMELLDGAVSLVEHAHRNALDVAARIATFRQVCDAVLHAHQRGVIHRDLKPANILVDASGTPKVIDFGIARATDLEGTRESLATRAGDFLGTLRYMAPEQVDGRADQVDVRTDVYALGVVLFELLTGAAPIEVEESTLDEAVRRIRVEPPRRLRQLAPHLAREHEWIVARAIEKEPQRRYPSVAALALDLERLSTGEPLLAGPPGVAYRARLFAKRHRVALAVGAVVVLLLAGWIVSLIASIRRSNENAARADENARQAHQEVEKATDVIGLLQFAIGRASGDKQSSDVPISRIFDVMEEAIGIHGYDPEVEARLYVALGEFRLKLGQNDRAHDLIRRGVSRLASAGLSDSADARDASVLLAQVDIARGKIGAAGRELKEAAKDPSDDRRPNQDIEVSHGEIVVLLTQWQAAEAEPLAREIVERLTGEGRDPGDNLGVFQNFRARALAQLGRFDEALALAKAAVESEIRLHPEAPVRGDNARLSVASILIDAGKPAEALEIATAATAAVERDLDPNHVKALAGRSIIARAKFAAGDRDAALTEAQALVARRVAIEGEGHIDLFAARTFLASVELALGRAGDARHELELALGPPAHELRADHPEVARARALHGRALVLEGNRDAGLAEMEAALVVLRRELVATHPRLVEAESWLADPDPNVQPGTWVTLLTGHMGNTQQRLLAAAHRPTAWLGWTCNPRSEATRMQVHPSHAVGEGVTSICLLGAARRSLMRPRVRAHG